MHICILSKDHSFCSGNHCRLL